MGWIWETLGEICRKGGGRIQTGPFGSQLHESDYRPDGIPVVMPTDIVDGRIAITRIARVPESHVERLKRHKLSKGDIVYGRRGDIGRQAVARDENVGWLCGTGCLKISLGNGPLAYEFLHRYLSTTAVVGWIEGQAVGATMPNLNTGILERVPVFYPENRATQQKISAILSAYDDLIENNCRRIVLLEKMAEEIYREWFVRMRFPGHAQTKFEKGVPTGWRVGKISDAASFKYGFTESALENPEWPKFLRVTDMNKRSFINWDDVPNCPIDDVQFEKYRLRKDDILIARMADPGKVAIVEEDIRAVFASYLIKIEYNQKNVTPYFFFYTLGSAYYLGLFSGADSGSTRGSINASAIGSTAFIYPDFDLMRLFDEKVSALREEMVCLSKLNGNLVKAREGLLPRLISGKHSVESLDIQFPPDMLNEAEREEPKTAHA